MKYRFVWINNYAAIIRAICFDDKSIYAGSDFPSDVLEKYVSSVFSKLQQSSRVYKIELPDGILAGFFVMNVSDSGVYSQGQTNLRSQFKEPDIVSEIQDQINKFVASMLPALKIIK